MYKRGHLCIAVENLTPTVQDSQQAELEFLIVLCRICLKIPLIFTYDVMFMQRVTPWNVTSLRDAIINGPDIHPGATHYVDRVSTVRLQPNRKSRISASRKLPSSRGVVTQPGRGFNYEYEGKVVHRHLRNGDIVLVNRQVKQEKPQVLEVGFGYSVHVHSDI